MLNQDFQTIIVPVSGDPDRDYEAISIACTLYRGNVSKRTVIGLRVIEIDRSLPINADLTPEIQSANDMLDEIRLQTEELFAKNECDFVADVRQARVIGSAIIEDANEFKADLIILSLNATQEFGEYCLGDTVSYVLENAKCRVIVDQEIAPKD